MNSRRQFAALLFVLLLTCSLAAKALALPDENAAPGVPAETGGAQNDVAQALSVTAEHAALIEGETGRTLYARRADEHAYMASTTKIMTALVALERGDLDALIDVPEEAVACEGSKVYLARGEQISLRDALYGLMLVSGNDAAVAIAAHIGGSVAEFADLMNARAQELGCTGTHFVNPNGLPDENHYTTAQDLARIAAAGMQNEMFRTIVGTTYHETSSGDRARTFKNKNKILWQYEGGNGVKTGFTKAAGRCLVFSAQRGGMTLVGVVLNAPDMWEDAKTMLDYGFDRMERRLLVEAVRPLAQVGVTGGTKKNLEIYPKEDILVPLEKDGSDTVDWELRCVDALPAPVVPGTQAGTLILLVNGERALTVPLITAESVPCASLRDYLKQIASGWN